MIRCRIFGHRWDIFTAEQCPEIYRMCMRCDKIEHVCNAASAMSAGTAATTQIGAGLQPASAVPKADAQ